MIVSLVALGWYNQLRFHKVLVSSYGPPGGFDTPIWHGVDGLLLSPGRSMFIYNPLTFVGVAGLVLLFVGSRRVLDRPLGIVCVLMVVPRTLFFARWNHWDGGASWGPRYLLPAVAVLSLTIIPVLQATDRRRVSGILVRIGMVLLAGFAGVVNYLSVRLPQGAWFGALANPYWRTHFGIHGSISQASRFATIDFSWTASEIWGDFLLLRNGVRNPGGEWWAFGRGEVGWALLGAGAVVLLAAAFGARPMPKHRAHGSPF
jgi:hypothetical protein